MPINTQQNKRNTNPPCGRVFTLDLLHPKFWITWLGLGFAFLLALFPGRFRQALGNILGRYMYKYNKKRRHIISTNLKLAFPDMGNTQRDALTLKNLQMYARAMLDYGLLFFANKKRLAKFLHIDGKEHLDLAIKNGKPVMILLAHSVMLEFAPAALGQYYECFGSYKPLKNDLLDWVISKARCRHVAFVVSRDAGLRKLVKALTPGKVMIFLPDEDLGIKNAVFAPFFDHPKATLTSTARIAALTKSDAFPAFCWYDSHTHKYRLQLAAPLSNYPQKDPVAAARQLNQALEELIKAHPEQYMWQMKWFKTRPENEAALY